MIQRTNMANCTQEAWRPPLFSNRKGIFHDVTSALRRILDLQAGSIWQDLKRVLPYVSGVVVDVGCGAQPYRPLVPVQATYIGIDTVDARAHFGYEIADTRYYADDVWPVGDASANFLLCTETLEHVKDTAGFLREAFRCLAPGGTMLLTVPFAARWHFIPNDYWRFTPSGLKRVLGEAGFVNVRIYARGNSVTVACYKNMALILRLALPGTEKGLLRLLLQLLSLPFLPVLAVLAAIANISMYGAGGNDCLGYTALAEKDPA
jgi:SAM-dependent methyltransferase